MTKKLDVETIKEQIETLEKSVKELKEVMTRFEQLVEFLTKKKLTVKID